MPSNPHLKKHTDEKTSQDHVLRGRMGLFFFFWVALSRLDMMLLLYLTLFCHVCYLIEACSLLMSNRKEVDTDELGRWEGTGRNKQGELSSEYVV